MIRQPVTSFVGYSPKLAQIAVLSCDSKGNCTNFKQDLFYVDDGNLRLSWPRVVPCAQVERHLRMMLPLVGLHESFLSFQQEDGSERPIIQSGLVEKIQPFMQEYSEPTGLRPSGSSAQKYAPRVVLEDIEESPTP